jgi:hypothetical protein
MPNVNVPTGFKNVKLQSNEPYNGGIASVPSYRIASGYGTSIFAGDVVKMLATGYINLAAPTDQMRGVAIGFKWVDPTGLPKVSSFWPAGTVTKNGADAEIMLYDDPNIIYEGTFGNSSSVPTAADIGNTFASFTSAAGGNQASGLSGMGVDYSTVNTTAQHWRFVGFVPRPDNDTASAYSRGWFTPALHDFRVNTGI